MIYKIIHEIKVNGFKSTLVKSLNKTECSIKKTFNTFSKITLDNIEPEFIQYQEHQPLNTKLKTIAFYLPQFHPFPENDKWWGKGFTEWTNVTKAKPNFVGHYQPHLPIHSGFYDLRIPEIMIEQAKLARNYGIYGFNFYYYWFDGKILMEKPYEILLKHKEIDINFCITWANENWTRRWDGLENEVLIAQNHSEKDSIKFIQSLYKYFEDKRYIRIDNKPVLIIYRSSIIPDIQKIGKIWREELVKAGFDGLYLVCAQTTGTYNPNDIGFDAAMEFPPHSIYYEEYLKKVEVVNSNFKGAIIDYSVAAEKALSNKEPDFKLFKTSILSWDNTARRQDNATVFYNFSTDKYKNWMTHLYKTTLENSKYSDDEKLVFVNAWNEWAEGTHLEPDAKYGYAYLEATYKSLRDTINPTKKIIVVSHDAHPHGAQYLALYIIKDLKEYFNYEIEILLHGDGILSQEFEKYGRVHFTHQLSKNQRNTLLKNLYSNGFTKAIANTSVVGEIVEELDRKNILVLSLVHEMKSVIKKNHLEKSLMKIAKYSKAIVFPSKLVKKDLDKFIDLKAVTYAIKPQGLFRVNQYKYTKESARKKLLEELEIHQDSKIVLNVAYGDYRKGIDLFVASGIEAIKQDKKIHFVWVGHYETRLMDEIISLIKKEHMEKHFHFLGLQEDIDHYYAGSDIFFLSSREDPFPSVVLDAMNIGLPVIAFDGAGGFVDIMSKDCGILVDINDMQNVLRAITKLLHDTKTYSEISKNSMVKIETDFSFTKYLVDLLQLLNEDIKEIL